MYPCRCGCFSRCREWDSPRRWPASTCGSAPPIHGCESTRGSGRCCADGIPYCRCCCSAACPAMSDSWHQPSSCIGGKSAVAIELGGGQEQIPDGQSDRSVAGVEHAEQTAADTSECETVLGCVAPLDLVTGKFRAVGPMVERCPDE